MRLADSIIIPINTTQYTLELNSYLTQSVLLPHFSYVLITSDTGIVLLYRVERMVATSSLFPKPDLTSLRKSIDKLQKASTKLDKTKLKAEKALRKALEKIGKPKGRKHHAKVYLKRKLRELRNWISRVLGVPPGEPESFEFAPHHQSQPRQGVNSDHILPFEERSLDDDHTHEKRVSPFDSIRVGHAGSGAWTPPSRREFEREEPYRGPGKRSDSPDSHPHSRPGCVHESPSPHTWIWDAIKPSGLSSNSTSASHLPKRGAIRKLIKAAKAVRVVNDKLAHFESGFISEAGIKDREWYRHLGVAPGKWLGYGATTFPALSEALDERNATLASDEAERLAKMIVKLAKFLDV